MTSRFNENNPISEIFIVYDGECPFCQRYTKYLKLKESVEQVHMINARESEHKLVKDIVSAGFNLDEGMAVKIGDFIYHGDDCVHVLALLSSRQGVFNKINAAIFQKPYLAKILYPVLKSGRNFTLKILGKSPLNAESKNK